ncbi:MAG TPA: SUMF1/EgtB/PvdO family nonheme iron enzyme [Gemmataceae bacterium]|jgi:serine/threonine-protein kinase|nr:SUMF1/EgtB/PvdO family nonheme iron enzyme [Gemmataceae bacterium]
MSRRRSEHPSAQLLEELKALAGRPADKGRSRRAWEIVVRSAAAEDFFVLHDFALENGLTLSCDAGPRAKHGQAPPVKTWVNPIDRSEMVWIPPGPFVVGDDNVRAESAGFSLARHPVTNAQFERFLKDTGYKPPEGHPGPELFLRHWEKGKPPKDKKDHPAVFVSLLDALAYCKWAGLTLPTEWLWEKAARGPEGRTYPWGGAGPVSRTGRLANVGTDGTCAVGSYARTRSPYGCEDLVGNVSEWCRTGDDKDHGRFPEPWPEVKPDPDALTVVRGACFYRTVFSGMAAAHRRRLSVVRRNQWTSFRPALLLSCRPAQ